jgi:hypothetical protein
MSDQEEENWRAMVEANARPGDIANLILERDRLHAELKKVRQLSRAVRVAQKEYFMYRDKDDLIKSKTLEAQLDKLLQGEP